MSDSTIVKIEGRRAASKMADTKEERTTVRFNGELDESYADFKAAARFELSLVDSDKRMKHLTKMLGIRPKVTLSHNIPSSGTFSTPTEIWAVLDAAFADGAQADRAATELERLRQKNMPLPEFNYKFENLCSQAGVTGTFMAQMYRDKLVPGIGDRLRINGASSYSEMKRLAGVFAPDAERDYKRQQKAFEKKKDTKKVGDPKARGARTETREKKITCFRCQKPGHYARECEDEAPPRKKEVRQKARQAPQDEEQLSGEDEDGPNDEYRRSGYVRPWSGKGKGSKVPTDNSARFEGVE